MERFGDEELTRVTKVVKSGVLSRGEMTDELEKTFAEKFGVKHAVAVNSAMSGLHCAIHAAGVGPGDEVICDPIVHFGAGAVMYNNGVPVFADVDPNTLTIDPESVRQKVTERTKALIGTSLYGMPFDIDAIREIADEHGFHVIEDNAGAIAARYHNNEYYVGSLGDFGVFSFEQSKQLTSGDGGIVTTNDEARAENMMTTRIIGRTRPGDERWRTGRLGWNYRMTEMVAAILLGQLERCETIVGLHREAASIYLEVLDGCPWLRPQLVPEGYTHTYLGFPFVFDGDLHGIEFDDFKATVGEAGVSISYGSGIPSSSFAMFAEPRAYGKGCPTRCPLYEGSVSYGADETPVARDVLSRMMVFGLNVWKMDSVKENAGRLAQAIRAVDGS